MNVAKTQAIKDFDFLLENPSVKELKKTLKKKTALLEKNLLLPKIKEVVEHLKYQFRKQDNAATSLAEQYNSRLDVNSNSDIQKDFVRVTQGTTIYYG